MNEVILVTVATYGISTLVADYNGPWGVFRTIREGGEVFECAVCLSIWVGLVLSIGFGISFLGYIAVIGGVIILDRVT